MRANQSMHTRRLVMKKERACRGGGGRAGEPSYALATCLSSCSMVCSSSANDWRGRAAAAAGAAAGAADPLAATPPAPAAVAAAAAAASAW